MVRGPLHPAHLLLHLEVAGEELVEAGRAPDGLPLLVLHLLVVAVRRIAAGELVVLVEAVLEPADHGPRRLLLRLLLHVHGGDDHEREEERDDPDDDEHLHDRESAPEAAEEARPAGRPGR